MTPIGHIDYAEHGLIAFMHYRRIALAASPTDAATSACHCRLCRPNDHPGAKQWGDAHLNLIRTIDGVYRPKGQER